MGKIIKICPNKQCGHHNLPYFFVCEKCDMDLTGVNPIDEDSIIPDPTVPPGGGDVGTSSEPHVIRICEECGHHNPVNMGICENCEADISGVIPTVLEEQADGEIHFEFCSLDGSYAYGILSDNVIIGRENEMEEYLISKPFVSRKQAEVSLKDGKLFIRNLTDKQTTFINNTRIIDDELHEINDGDEIGLGGFEINGTRTEKAAFFIVRIGNCDG